MTLWSDAQLASIHKMLNPRSLAIVGATPRLQYGGRMLAAALNASDRVNIYPVNPRYDEIMDTKCYASVSDLPEAPDLVAIVVPYDRVLDVLRESHQKGVGAAIVISAGFSERGEDDRRNLQIEMGEFALSSGMRISGPNCLGIANIKDDIWVSASSLGAAGQSGKIGLVCQSGASAFGPFLNRAMDGGVGFTYVVSTGNEADLDFSDFVRYLLDDADTKVIAGFVEGFKDARKFIEVAKTAAQIGKPIVLIKIGRSELGAKAALSHTAALTGTDALYDAAMAQHGVIRVQDYDELLEVSQLLAQMPRPVKSAISVVSHSGGISSLTADMCGQAGLDLPPLSNTASDGINEILKGFGWAANPADVTGFANSESFPQIMNFMIDEPEVGTLVVASSGGDPQAEQVIDQRDQSLAKPVYQQKGLVFLWTGSRNTTAGLEKLKKAQVPVFYAPNRLATGLRSYLDYHQWLDKFREEGFPHTPAIEENQTDAISNLPVNGGGHNLSELDSKALIEAWGVPGTRETLVSSQAEAVAAARVLRHPVALKLDSPDVLHKTEAGVVWLGLDRDQDVWNAYAKIMSIAEGLARSQDTNPDSPSRQDAISINGVLVQEMVSGAVEVIIGISYDAQLGPVLLFGTGGVMVEVYNDVALRLCPVSLREAHEMIAQVKGSVLLRGFRGQPPADIHALAETLVCVSHMGMHLEGRLSELDINPLMVLPEGQGVKAADALAIFADNS